MVFSSHIFLFYFLPFAWRCISLLARNGEMPYLPKVKLNVFPAEKHKELQNEYTVEGLSVFDLPMYYSSEINIHH